MSSNPKDPMTNTPGNVPHFVRPDPAYLPRAVTQLGTPSRTLRTLGTAV